MKARELSLSDLEGLPDDLIAELPLSDADWEDLKIMDLMQDGPISLNNLLIGLYQKDGKVRDRSRLYQRLYRMASKGVIESVKGEKSCFKKADTHV